jgi:hypothetical protein
VTKVISAEIVPVIAASTLVVVVGQWGVLVTLDFTGLTEDVAWWKWLVALVTEPVGLVTDTLDTVAILNLVGVFNAVLTIVGCGIVAAEAEIVADTLVVATVWAGPVSIADTAGARVSSMLNTASHPVSVRWSVTVLHTWVAETNPDGAAGLGGGLVVLPAWLTDAFTFLVSVGVGDAADTVALIWAVTAGAGQMTVLLFVLATVSTLPSVVSLTSSVWVNNSIDLNAVSVLHTEDTAGVQESRLVPSITAVTDWVAVSGIESTALTSPVSVTLTVHQR